MKQKAIEKIPPLAVPEKRKAIWGTTAQREDVNGDDILILNIFKTNRLAARHCINLGTGEYATWLAAKDSVKIPYPMAGSEAVWTDRQLSFVYCEGDYYRAGYDFAWNDRTWNRNTELVGRASKDIIAGILEEEKAKREKVILEGRFQSYPQIPELPKWRIYFNDLEEAYARKKRVACEDRRLKRVNDVMHLMPELPGDFEDWVYKQMFAGVPGEAIHDVHSGLWFCSECHEKSEREKFRDEKGSKAKTNGIGICPVCGAQVRIQRKTKVYNKCIKYSLKVCLFNVIDEELSVVRYFDAIATSTTIQKPDEPRGKKLSVQENIRIVLPKESAKDDTRKLLLKNKDKKCRIYYRDFHGFFDYKSNPMQRHAAECFAYPNGEITECLKDTVYSEWSRTFEAASRLNMKVDYNRCMIGWKNKRLCGVAELLLKGRFYRLFERFVSCINVWEEAFRDYWGININPYGGNASEVLGLTDGQNINRLRDMDGDYNILAWLKWSESKNRRISQEALVFYGANGIFPYQTDFIYPRMSPEQIMHYVKKQKEVSYPGLSAGKVLEQWTDYMRMAKDLNKKVNDEMIYRPKELKLRHDEYVEECNRKRQMIKAKHDREYAKQKVKEYNAKFPRARAVLKKIKPKLEWENEDYMIVVPKELTEIIFEGQQLHHCAGATDRYFDRIEQEETYIVFLREKKHKNVPFYTIEVEPGGTIRQHRGMYDEEPDIDKIKPALREWQKEIRRRMKEEDHKKAAEAKRKRAENIRELEEKRNTRVLNGLMEDLMEVEDILPELQEVVNG